MKLIKFFFTILLFNNCSNNFKISPAIIEKVCISKNNDGITLSIDSNCFVSRKLFEGKNCPKIIYNPRYFDELPFLVKRTIPINIDSNIVFIDFYGRGIDSLKNEELEVKFFLDGSQIVELHKVSILDRCYTIGNDVETEILKNREVGRIATKWGLKLAD